MLQTIILLTFTLASFKLYIPQRLNVAKFKPKLKFSVKTVRKSSKSKSNGSNGKTNGKTRWRGVRPETLQIAEILLPKVGEKLLHISHRSSDQAAKRKYHASNREGIRDLISEAEELDKQLKRQRKKSLSQIDNADTTGMADIVDIVDISSRIEGDERSTIKEIKQAMQAMQAKKKPGRTKNPVPTKVRHLEISKEKHGGHRLKDHGLTSHTVVDIETAIYQWQLEVIKYQFRQINCLDCKVLLSPKGGWPIPKGALYGYALRSLLISWRMALGISYGDCGKLLRSFTSLCEANAPDAENIGTIPIPNEDTMKKWILQASDCFRPQLNSLHQQIQSSEVLYIDETPISLNGECWFVWVICIEKSYYYLLKPSKGLDALKEVVVGC